MSTRHRGALAAGACALVCVAAAAGAPAAGAQTDAGLRVGMHPDRPGAKTALTIAFTLSGGGEEGVPPPLRRLALHLPPGFVPRLAGVPACALGRLRRHGPSGCPAASQLGRGAATLEVHAGSQLLSEHSSLWALRLPNRSGHPALAIYGIGYTPLNQTSISTGPLAADSAPYGSQLLLSVPPIPTVVFEPDASFLSSTLTLGGSAARVPGAVRVPARCPAGGFPFGADFLFADGSQAHATATVGCPGG